MKGKAAQADDDMSGYKGYLNLHNPLEMQVIEDEERCEEETTGECQPLLPFPLFPLF